MILVKGEYIVIKQIFFVEVSASLVKLLLISIKDFSFSAFLIG